MRKHTHLTLENLAGEYKTLLAAESTPNGVKQLWFVLVIDDNANSVFYDVPFGIFQGGIVPNPVKRLGTLSKAIRYYNSLEVPRS